MSRRTQRIRNLSRNRGAAAGLAALCCLAALGVATGRTQTPRAQHQPPAARPTAPAAARHAAVHFARNALTSPPAGSENAHVVEPAAPQQHRPAGEPSDIRVVGATMTGRHARVDLLARMRSPDGQTVPVALTVSLRRADGGRWQVTGARS
jgi:hypothetical protein